MKLAEALNRQKVLFEQCKKCEHRIGYKFAGECLSCPVQSEMLGIGEFISENTLARRRGKQRGSS